MPRIAIVGRPNVGKSSLLNRLAGRRVSIVDPTPGVTRDRVSVEVELPAPAETPRGTPDITCEVTDTGGYGVYVAEGRRFDDIGSDLAELTGDIERQISLAIDHADLILFVTDAHQGVTALDRTIAKLLRQRGAADRVLPIANKVDGEKWLADGVEAAALGFGEPIGVSAENAFNIRMLRDTLYERLWPIALAESRSKPADEVADERDMDDRPDSDRNQSQPIKVAIVGKRNSGKSSLINAWAGEDRVIVSEIAGTTRDSVDVRLDVGDRSIIAIDTAGLRKRKSFADDIEFYAFGRMIDAIKRSDVALLLLDASAEASQVDQKLASELKDQFKPTAIVVNKWDLAEAKGLTPEDYSEYLLQQLRGLDFAPIVFISARDGQGLEDLLTVIFDLHRQASHRETTGRLNSAIEDIMELRGPSSKGGAKAKVFFVSQVAVRPPTIVLSVNKPDLFHGRYERFLLHQLRERLPFAEVPIKLLFRERSRVPLEDLKHRSRGESKGTSPKQSAAKTNKATSSRGARKATTASTSRDQREASARGGPRGGRGGRGGKAGGRDSRGGGGGRGGRGGRRNPKSRTGSGRKRTR